MEQPPPEADDKALDSTSALEKVLRLDKKHTNFDYYDPLRNLTIKVAYPQLQPEGPSSEALLKSLWRHACNYYFKPIEDGELRRLHYLKTAIQPNVEGDYRFQQSDEFWSTVDAIFSHQYLHKYLKGEKQRLQLQNSLEMMHVVWQISNTKQSKTQKRKAMGYQQVTKDLKRIWRMDQGYRDKLLMESRRLKDELVFASDHNNEIGQQIHRLERELREISREVTPTFNKLQERVIQEANLQDIIYCQNHQSEQAEIVLQNANRVDRKLKKLQAFEVLTKYIEYTIRQLQKKQIAQSVSKILRVEKSKGQIKLILAFEEAMGIKPITVTESQFTAINDLREYSLLKFYNTASKSPYTFICQNYLGFKDMYEHRSRPCNLKDKNILHQMKRAPIDPLSAGYQKEFAKMEICHHCKLLHPESALVKCEYRSSRCGNPVPPSPYYDSYIYQILKNEQSRVSAIRFLNSSQHRRNSYFHYLKKDDEYVCERKYCRYCLKNYQESKDKNGGLCPYCRGICYCTRCTRNETIVRLKSLYILLGGDINQLQENGIFEKYYHSQDDSISLRRKEKSHSKSIRRSHSAPSRLNEKMLNIRYQLEDLRLICDLVKRREKSKQKLHTCLKEAFVKKIELIDPDFQIKRQDTRTKKEEKTDPREMSDQENNDRVSKVKNGKSKSERTGPIPKVALPEKLAKKLKRMIE